MFAGSIEVLNPLAKQIEDIGVDRLLMETDKLEHPFLQLLSGRWLAVAANDPQHKTSTITDLKNPSADLIVCHDWVLKDYLSREGIDDAHECKVPILRFNDLPSWELGNYTNGAMNSFYSGPDAIYDERQYDTAHVYNIGSLSPYGKLAPIVVPFGCPSSWLPKVEHADKVIFLDEPHNTVLDKSFDDQSMRSKLFRHAIQVAEELHGRGFEIISFCRFPGEVAEKLVDDYPFINFISSGKWVPLQKLFEYFARSSLFYAFVHETHGYSQYENLQIGNGVIAYAENVDPYRFKQMQNAALLSVYMSPKISADFVSEYYDRYASLQLRSTIRANAERDFSCETFIGRLRAAMADRTC